MSDENTIPLRNWQYKHIVDYIKQEGPTWRVELSCGHEQEILSQDALKKVPCLKCEQNLERFP